MSVVALLGCHGSSAFAPTLKKNVARVRRSRTWTHGRLSGGVASTPNADPDAIMSDDPLIVRLEEECARLNGGDWNDEVGLQQLLNPSKVFSSLGCIQLCY